LKCKKRSSSPNLV